MLSVTDVIELDKMTSVPTARVLPFTICSPCSLASIVTDNPAPSFRAVDGFGKTFGGVVVLIGVDVWAGLPTVVILVLDAAWTVVVDPSVWTPANMVDGVSAGATSPTAWAPPEVFAGSC